MHFTERAYYKNTGTYKSMCQYFVSNNYADTSSAGVSSVITVSSVVSSGAGAAVASSATTVVSSGFIVYCG